MFDRLPHLQRFLGMHCLIGIGISWAVLAALVLSDVGGLGGLLTRSSDGLLAIAMLAGGFAVTFGSAAMGTAVILMPYESDEGDGTDVTRIAPRRARPQTHDRAAVRVRAR